MSEGEASGSDPSKRRDSKKSLTRLDPIYLVIAIGPVLVLVLSDALINHYAWPVTPVGPAPFKEPIFAYEESAARLRVVLGFLLVAFAATSAAIYSLHLSRGTDASSRWYLIGTALVLAVLTVACLQSSGKVEGPQGTFYQIQTQQFADQALMCRAASLGEPRRQEIASRHPGACQARHFLELRDLVEKQRLALTAALLAVVLGSLLCLAERGPQAPDEPADRLLKAQARRLNMVLYLAAFMLVSGLLFLSAFLHYPSFALSAENAEIYGAGANMIVMFYGVSFSLLIASFYVPAAAVLMSRWEAAKPDGDPEKETGIVSTSQLFKAGAAMLAPILAGLLTEGVKLPGF